MAGTGHRAAGVIWTALARKAELRARAGLRRSVIPRDESAIDLAGNDYLGLSRHPSVIAAAMAALAEYGVGATASRLVRGTTAVHEAIEVELAKWLGFSSALVYSSGYLANIGAVRALARRDAPLIVDAHAHASLIDGCRATGVEVIVGPHNDVDFVAERVRPGAVVVVESVYSVDGDAAPLFALHAACRGAGALLLIDDAHGLGVLGPGGAGGAAAAGIAGEPDVVVTATLSKTLGAAGGVVAGHEVLRRHLIDTGRTFIYDTAPPPALLAGARAALVLARDADDARRELRARATLAAALLGASMPVGGVLAVRASSSQAAVDWVSACREGGVAVGCFRPPSTPDGRARLRLTINVGVPRPDFDQAMKVILACAP